MVEADRPQMTTWRMRIACWITKATNTHSEYVIRFAFPLYENALMLCLYVQYIACLVWQYPVALQPYRVLADRAAAAGQRS